MWEMKKAMQPDRLHAHPIDIPKNPNVAREMRKCDALPPVDFRDADSTTQGLIKRRFVPGEPANLEAYRTFENAAAEDEPTIRVLPHVGPTKNHQMEVEEEGYDVGHLIEPEGDLEAIDDLRS